jgi:hypothetical protein
MRVLLAFLVCLVPGAAFAQALRLGETIERAGVSLRMLARRPLVELEGEGYRLTQQRSEDGTLTVQIYHGPRLVDPIGEVGAPRDVRICGRAAARTEHVAAETSATPYFLRDGHVVHGAPVIQPARTTVRVVFRHGDEHFVILWAGPPASIARNRGLERAFFRSITCRSVAPASEDPPSP